MDIRHLILCLTTRCNLACAYCYHGETPGGVDMSEGVLEKALQLASSGTKPLHVQLTGGEPALVPEQIFRAVNAIRELPRPTSMAIQTNGTRLTPELIDFLAHHRVQVGISLDGPPAIQEKLRGRAADTLKGLALLEERNVPFRVTTVVSRENAALLDRLVLTLAGYRSARGIGLDLLVTKGRAASGLLPADPSDLQKGVFAMLDTLSAVNARRRFPLVLRELEFFRQSGSPEKKRRTFCRASRGQSLAVHPDGRLFPCGQSLGDDTFSAGDVRRPLPERLMRLANHRLFSNACQSCPANGRCPGDCPSRIYYNREEDKALVCVLYRTLWKKMRRPAEP